MLAHAPLGTKKVHEFNSMHFMQKLLKANSTDFNSMHSTSLIWSGGPLATNICVANRLSIKDASVYVKRSAESELRESSEGGGCIESAPELALELNLQQQKKNIYQPSTGYTSYAALKPSGLINSVEWRSYYAKLVADKRGERPCKASAGFSIKNRQYDQMLFNDCVIDISAPYPFGVVHLKQNYQRRLPANITPPPQTLRSQQSWGSSQVECVKGVIFPQGAKNRANDSEAQRRGKQFTSLEVNHNQLIEQGEVTSPFFQNFRGVQKKAFFTNSKIIARPFIMDEQVKGVGIGSFVTRTKIPFLGCASNQTLLPVDPPLYTIDDAHARARAPKVQVQVQVQRLKIVKRVEVHVENLKSSNLKTRGVKKDPPLESLYNKFHTLPIFSTFIYKEWLHRFSFLEYFIWSARKNDLGLPFYSRRGACHTTRINSINLIRNQIVAFSNRRLVSGGGERRSKGSETLRLPYRTRAVALALAPKVHVQVQEVACPQGAKNKANYLVSKNALQVIELRDKSSSYAPALSVKPVCLKKALFSSRFSLYNLYGCIESEALKTQQGSEQHERSCLLAKIEDATERIEQFASNNCTFKRGDYSQDGEEKRTFTSEQVWGDLCKVHQEDAEFIKKKVSASAVFRQIDKFFAWRLSAHVDFSVSPSAHASHQANYSVRSAELNPITPSPHHPIRSAHNKVGDHHKWSVGDKLVTYEQDKEQSTEVFLHPRVRDSRIKVQSQRVLGLLPPFRAKQMHLFSSYQPLYNYKVDQTSLPPFSCTSLEANTSNNLLSPSDCAQYTYTFALAPKVHVHRVLASKEVQSALHDVDTKRLPKAKWGELPPSEKLSSDHQPSTNWHLRSPEVSNDNCAPHTSSGVKVQKSAEMWGKVDDTQQFPRLAELLHFTGGTALRHLLSRFHLVLLGKFIRHELKNLELKVNFLLALKMLTYSQGLLLGKLAKRRSKQIRRLKLLELFQSKKSNPEWMILSILPVLPPDLRPILRVNDDFVVASDLNRLYQTVLRRNNTIHERLDDPLPCPESGLFRQRSLQKAVDGLLENGKGGGTPLCASKRRPLVSLSHVLKGKKGLFRQHLLGKRVDYSGRSVIVVGPKLNLHECGLPKEMALELFQPFLIHRLKVKGFATSNTTARRMIQQEDPIIWNIVKQLVYEHPVLLNRAPTLHRLGIQAFQPRLVSGRAILLHPLVCNGFNADFDGDQMAVHVPLSFQARAEAWKIMWSKNNLLSPATGQPILVPSQDMVLGCYYLTVLVPRVGSLKQADGDSLVHTCTSDASSAKLCTESAPSSMQVEPKPPRFDHEINSVAQRVPLLHSSGFNSMHQVQKSEVELNPFYSSCKPIYFPGYFKKTQHLGFLTDTNFAIGETKSLNFQLSHLIDRGLPFELLKNNTGSFTPFNSMLTGKPASASFFEPGEVAKIALFDASYQTVSPRGKEQSKFISSTYTPSLSMHPIGAKKTDNSKKVHNSAYHLKRGHYFSSLQDSLMAYSQGRLQTHTPFWVRLDYSVADVKKNGTIPPLVIDQRCKPSIDCIPHTCEDVKVQNNEKTKSHSVLLKTAVVPSSKKKISQLLCDNPLRFTRSVGTYTSSAPPLTDQRNEASECESSEINSALSTAFGSTKVSLHPVHQKCVPDRRIKVQPYFPSTTSIFFNSNSMRCDAMHEVQRSAEKCKEVQRELDMVGFSTKLVMIDGKLQKKVGENNWCKNATNDREKRELVENHILFLQPQYGRSQELSKVLIASSMHKEDYNKCVIEGNDTLEAPLELRLAADGNLVKISPTFQKHYNWNATILDQYKEKSIRYIRTTAGRVVINDKIVNLVNRNIF